MLNRIKAFFAAPHREPSLAGLDPRLLAAACLMVESARLDSDFSDLERNAIMNLLTGRFNLAPDEADTLLQLAESKQTQTGGLFRFTHTVKEGFDAAGRIDLIEMLWDIAYADGCVDDYEANLISRVAGLLYVSDVDRGAARKRAQARSAAH
jgi:uncharacterized tellurite resistance protein B-like protein